MRLRGKVALLTGAAAAIKGELMGFGGAAAHLFVAEGAKVVLTDIRDELGERAAAALRAEGHDARYQHLDVTSEQNWAEVVDAVRAVGVAVWEDAVAVVGVEKVVGVAAEEVVVAGALVVGPAGGTRALRPRTRAVANPQRLPAESAPRLSATAARPGELGPILPPDNYRAPHRRAGERPRRLARYARLPATVVRRAGRPGPPNRLSPRPSTRPPGRQSNPRRPGAASVEDVDDGDNVVHRRQPQQPGSTSTSTIMTQGATCDE